MDLVLVVMWCVHAGRRAWECFDIGGLLEGCVVWVAYEETLEFICQCRFKSGGGVRVFGSF